METVVEQVMENEPKVVKSFYSIVVKRSFDIVLSVLALIVLSPVFAVISILELIFHGSPITYKTKRPGKDGKIFRPYKFRSMTNERGADGYLLNESERLTKFGAFLRRLSLDELPQLLNILKGDMSIIGPRPLPIEYLPLYSKRHAARQSVRPGLACVRIIPSDSKTWTWREQFENDIYYIEHISLLTDIKMIFAIIREVIKGSDYRTNDTRVAFDGTNLDEVRGRDEVGKVVRFESISK